MLAPTITKSLPIAPIYALAYTLVATPATLATILGANITDAVSRIILIPQSDMVGGYVRFTVGGSNIEIPTGGIDIPCDKAASSHITLHGTSGKVGIILLA